MALEDLRKAKQKGDEEAKVEKAKEEVQKAKKKVEKAKKEVEKAEEKVEKAEEEKVEKAKEESLPLLDKFAGELGDLEERILNSRINNKEDRPFLERDEVIQSIVEEMKKTRRSKENKPRVVALWSPRGTGKTSVIRRLAKMDEYAESRRCGRLLVFDAQQIADLQGTRFSAAAPSTLVSAMVLWHLLQLLDGFRVEVARQMVKFKRMDFNEVVEVVERRSRPTGSVNSFEAWVRSACTTKDDVFKQWCLVTAAAFKAQQGCACLVLLDQTELLVKQRLDQRSSLGGSRSTFTEVCSQFPQQMAVYCTGTINIMLDVPVEEYSRLFVVSLPALKPLSLESAKQVMQQRQMTQYKDEVFNQIFLLSAGVPRLLGFVFETDGELASTIPVAFNAMSSCFKEAYQSAAPFFEQPEVAWSLVLCSAVCWKAKDSKPVPGTSKRWAEVFAAGAAFPGNGSVMIPRVWWCEDAEVKTALIRQGLKVNISLEGLLPDPADLLQASQQGPVIRGTLWEEQVCNALAARFYLYCLADSKTPCDTYAPFLEIYPTTDDHLRSVLEQFSVCWSDGVEYPDQEASVFDRVGKAIKSNKNIKKAHHDLLIPVKRIATGDLEYIAAQCRCGSPKTATELTKTCQDKTRKLSKNETRNDLPDMPNVLLQISSTSEGTQNFQKTTPWAKRQEEKRYSLMSCKAIIAQLQILRIL